MRQALLLALALAGCTAPEIGRPPEPAALEAPYPGLLPLPPLLAAGQSGTLDTAQVAAIQAEGAAVEAQGRALRDRPLPAGDPPPVAEPEPSG